ncbi:MAG: GAF domain-containing sensor histidine kinase [Clostridia bacterium]|nr:GAF domain-containing sensor histidine kinase [Clostridia bacterium]
MLDEVLKELYDIGKLLMMESDTLKLLERIIDSSMLLTTADAGTLYLVVDKETGEWSSLSDQDDADRLLKFVIARNESITFDYREFQTPVTKSSIYGYSAVTGEALRIDDAYAIGPDRDYKHNKSFDENNGYVTRSVLAIPMKNHENQVIGVVQLINKKKQRNKKIDYSSPHYGRELLSFDNNDEMIMNSLAGQAAIALENNQLYRHMEMLLKDYVEQNKQLVTANRKVLQAHEEERKRIARDIHDGPAQMVANMSLRLEICKAYLQKGNLAQLEAEMTSFKTNIQNTVKEIRTIIYDLKPSCLEEGLFYAVEQHVESFKANTGLPVALSCRGEDQKLEYYLTSTLYRIVQEALSNIKKHAEAQKVEIDVKVTPDRLSLVVLDDGKGFDTNKPKAGREEKLKGGFGLEGIRERVELIRGTISIESAPGKGTRLAIEVPLG